MLTRTQRTIHEKARWMIYPVSFVSFWVALYLQSILTVQLAKIVPAAYLNLSTIAAMWILAAFVIPFILYLIIIKMYLKDERRR